ncbi:DUF4199 domain-containing protein [Aquimarina sp. D1M17]|uniref:DUF4199 domain-containing protein n=1 Tax=Aquimarina acroporae TaxID=2937283 RepID=UPI0020C0CF5A|nr:DUF4199 domain-containing protein [Aquimarina acroporae]MCK8523041.1 DUF4199 domain-containing protein [Aquimarina acroporae]
MKTNKTSIYKHILKYGVIYGFLWAIKYLTTYLIFNSLSAPKQWNTESIIIELFLNIGWITYTIYQFKKNNDGYLKFLDAFKIGFFLGIFSFIYNEIWYLFYANIINPEYLNSILEKRKENIMLKNPELSAKEIDQITSAAYTKLKFKTNVLSVLFLIIYNSIIASIAGAIMHKKKKM